MTYAQRIDGIERLEGEWKDGLLVGEIKANIINTGWIEGYYRYAREFNKIYETRRRIYVFDRLFN